MRLLSSPPARDGSLSIGSRPTSLEAVTQNPRTQACAGPFDLQFQVLPAGEFQMGSDNGYDNERPVHCVKISGPFQMGRFPVTQAQWKTVMGHNPSYFLNGDESLPVEQVSWEDIQLFVARLNALNDGFSYRLPTEAEWEYAARAGEAEPNGRLDELAWYAANSGGKPHSVGTKKPNAWGLHDMYGNVWEWVQDCYDPNYYSASPQIDPTGPAEGRARAHRGGGFGTAADFCRSAFRIGCSPDARYNITGFRLVRTRAVAS